jgi:MFS family permease
MKKPKFNRQLRILLSTNALILFAGAMLGPIYAIFVEEVGGDILDAGLAGAVFALAAGVTTLISGRIVDGMKENEIVLITGYLIMSAGFLFYLRVDSVMMILVAQVIVGFGEALYSPAFDAIYSKHLDKGKAGSEWGAWESMNYFTVALASAVGGFLAAKFGFELLFIIMSILCLVSAAYLYLLPRKVL